MSSKLNNPEHCPSFEKSKNAFFTFLNSSQTSIDVFGLQKMCQDISCPIRRQCLDTIYSADATDKK